MQAGAPDGDDERDRREMADAVVLREHVDSLYRQPLTVVPAGDMLAGAALAFAGYAAAQPVLIACGGLLGLVGLIRRRSQQSFRRRADLITDAKAVDAWHWRYTFLAWLAALLIGIAGWIGAHGGTPGLRLLTACTVFAATATMIRTGSYPRYLLAQIGLALAPLAAAWSTIHNPLFVVLTLLSLAYFGLLARISVGLHQMTFGALTAAERNRALADRLEQKNGLLERQDAELRAQALRFDAALANMAQGLAMFDAEHRLLVCNNRYLESHRFDPNIVKPGATMRQVVDHYFERNPQPGLDADTFYERQTMMLAAETPTVFTRSPSGGRVIEVNYRPMPGGGHIVTTMDITEQRRSRERIQHLASHDPLTDLVNRYGLPHRLRDALAGLDAGNGRRLAVLALGIDRFKQINDTFGHAAGDALLRTAAERLRAAAGPRGVVARMGGDEFVCIVSDLDGRDAIASLAADIGKALAAPNQIDARTVELTASIGIAIAPDDGADPDALLRNADVALHSAKAQERGGHVFFGTEMERLLRDRHDLEADLRSALQRGEFELHYQPLIEVISRRVVGCEALLRWNHPERGLIMPDQFIAMAEDSGLIVQLGEWVLRTAAHEAAGWREELKIAVNVSPLQFGGPALLNSVVSALAQSRLAAPRLELEITEAVLLRDTEDTLATLRKLRELGARIVMDDFGTGYSSLNYLRIFPFDKIKIDRSFVAGCKSRSESHAIIQAVADMAQSLGMTATAEGIETEEQLDAVRDRGCTEAQGFLFARPMPAAALRRFLARQDAARRAAA